MLKEYGIEATLSFVGDYQDYDRMISEYFGIDYECIPNEEWGNDEAHVFYVTKTHMDKYERKNCNIHDFSYMTQSFLGEMCYEGAIPEGNYTLVISW